ncbi:hypothetical protein GCM10011348_38460 [Marinobacterium nitratireducens]|uniref:Spermidine synthase n=1 Tax=Marinobacterium nitratireducens TaxID=518897 RepID=A0A918DVY9_9GAMM|nr:fused MFS/spermidine synthase [Marinobacterium nitratireducens]GGO86779.1 hypothetical protein GCM10011348_38460 [Marinobacterium nitratireducens]
MPSPLEYFPASDQDRSKRALGRTPPGHELHRAYDEWGPVRVIEEGPRRYLSFGYGGEQSCIHCEDPALPVFEYVQAMLLALLYKPAPRHVTLFGLGGGNLSNCLQAYDPTLQLTVVELRALVAETARNWLYLSEGPGLRLRIEDAECYAASSTERTDILFSDLFLDEGMQAVQLDRDFLGDCQRLLNPDGILVLNLWDEGQPRNQKALGRLKELFDGQCLLCPVNGGNLIALAFNGKPPVTNPRRLQQHARQLGRKVGVPLQRLLNQLQRF